MNSLKWMIANAAMATALVTGAALAQQPASDQPAPASDQAATPATPATSATPATPADPSTGTAATPATPATPADPATPAAKAGDDPLAPSTQEVAAEKEKATKKKAKKPR